MNITGSKQITLSLDQLVALNDELVALARAGVPLHEGLLQLGADMPGRLGRFAQQLGARLEAGQGLASAMESESDSFPPHYRAVVAAGIRSGKLGAALEGLASSLRQTAELRRELVDFLVYPLMVAGVAYVLFVLTALHWEPARLNLLSELGLAGSVTLHCLEIIHHSVWQWAPWAPLVVGPLFLWEWLSARSAGGRYPGLMSRCLRICTGRRNPQRAGALATFFDVLSLLLQHDVSLSEALPLAAQASGELDLETAAQAVVQRLDAGQPIAVRHAAAFPPLARWLFGGRNASGELIRALRLEAQSHRRRAELSIALVYDLAPSFFLVGIGGGSLIAYAMLVFWPYALVLYELGQIK